ncbi:Hypothetical protein PHPALM_14902 [Phytophthora palmivora]|uniref:Uncharacterized protein n=1 Tax=Phytophthora palmivora TaxID=4796 RepID=A0A2P4XTH9_9STRA|nr:Hypothetical protein PHPALM_14902 [Phytophthora palmivora]
MVAAGTQRKGRLHGSPRGSTPAERERVVKEHNAYLNGERASDAEFGPAAPDVAKRVAVAPALPRAAPPHPPRGKDACYLANAKALAARRLVEDAASKKKVAGKKKMSKSQAAAIRKAEKGAKEAQAAARAAQAAIAKTCAKKNERERLSAEVLGGQAAREKATKQLRQMAREETAKNKKSRPASKAKRKAPPESDSGRKKKHTKTSLRARQTADKEATMEPPSERHRPVEHQPSLYLHLHLRLHLHLHLHQPSLHLHQVHLLPPCHGKQPGLDQIDTDEHDPEVSITAAMDTTAASTAKVEQDFDGALNSDEEGSAGSDDSYSEMQSEVGDYSGTGDVGAFDLVPDDDGAVNDSSLDDSEVERLGAAIRTREKNREKQNLLRERLATAKVNLSRDWSETTDKWDTLTKDEMEVLALDDEALKKMRTDGWNFDVASQPVRAESYPGLYDREYEQTAEVLELADSPLRLFFYFMPPRIWRRIASESNRYYDQNLNVR